MVLEFFCPNGHRIVCTEDRAGEKARCPKCNVLFRIPGPDGANTTAKASLSGVGITGSLSLGNPGASGVPVSEPGKSGAGKEQIIFLCPNGHRVNAPPSLQGRPGQCPICGAQFVIPTMSEVVKTEELGFADDVASGSATRLPMPQQEALQTAGAHPLCNLMRKLWDEKQHGGIIEIHLANGALLTPDWFDEKHSRLSHGLFAAQSADGTVTMTIVAWDSIQRIVVRNVEGLPEGMF